MALLEDLKKQEDIVPNSYIFNTAMIACSKAVRVSHLFRWMSRTSSLLIRGLLPALCTQAYSVWMLCTHIVIDPEVLTSTPCLVLPALQGRLDDVLAILQEMREMSATSGPNLANYNIAIGSCARARWDTCGVNSPAI